MLLNDEKKKKNPKLQERKLRCFGIQNMDKINTQHEKTQMQYEPRNKEKDIVFSCRLICFFLSFVFLMKKRSIWNFPLITPLNFLNKILAITWVWSEIKHNKGTS